MYPQTGSRETDAGAQLAFSFLLSSGPQLMEPLFPHSRGVFLSQLSLSGNMLIITPEVPFPGVNTCQVDNKKMNSHTSVLSPMLTWSFTSDRCRLLSTSPHHYNFLGVSCHSTVVNLNLLRVCCYQVNCIKCKPAQMPTTQSAALFPSHCMCCFERYTLHVAKIRKKEVICELAQGRLPGGSDI